MGRLVIRVQRFAKGLGGHFTGQQSIINPSTSHRLDLAGRVTHYKDTVKVDPLKRSQRDAPDAGAGSYPGDPVFLA